MSLSELINEFVTEQHDLANYITPLLALLGEPETELSIYDRVMLAESVTAISGVLSDFRHTIKRLQQEGEFTRRAGTTDKLPQI